MDSAETSLRRRTVHVHAVGPRPLSSSQQQPTPGHPAPFPGRDDRRGRRRGGTAHSCAASVKWTERTKTTTKTRTTIGKSRLLSGWRPGRRRPLRPQRISFTIHGRPVHLFRGGTGPPGRLQTDHGSASRLVGAAPPWGGRGTSPASGCTANV